MLWAAGVPTQDITCLMSFLGPQGLLAGHYLLWSALFVEIFRVSKLSVKKSIAGIIQQSRFHLLASEILARTTPQHPIVYPSVPQIKITLFKTQRYDSLPAVR